MKIKNPDFKPFGFTIGQVKTWAALILGRDPQADQGMGIAREYSLEEAFKIYIYGKVVTSGTKLKEAQELLNNLWPILEREGLITLRIKNMGDILKVTITLFQDFIGTISIDLGEDTRSDEDGWNITTKRERFKTFFLKPGSPRREAGRVIDLYSCTEDFLKTLGLLKS